MFPGYPYPGYPRYNILCVGGGYLRNILDIHIQDMKYSVLAGAPAKCTILDAPNGVIGQVQIPGNIFYMTMNDSDDDDNHLS